MSNASRKMVDECARFCASIVPYLDGELDADHAVYMESHATECACCAERVALLRATRASLKRTSPHDAPAALRARICATLREERQRAEPNVEDIWSDVMSPKLIRSRYALGLAAAAGVIFMMGMSRLWGSRDSAASSDAAVAGSDTASTMGLDKLLDQLVALQVRPFPPEITDEEKVPEYDAEVGVRVQRPAWQPLRHFNGAHHQLLTDRGALLQLQYAASSGRRVSWYYFDPRTVDGRTVRLQQRVMRHQQMFVGKVRDYSAVTTQFRNVGYVVISDLGPEESADMMLATIQQ